MHYPVDLFTVIALIALPTVMFGGYSLLRLMPQGKLSGFQLTYFRAGHAHAGVLLVLALAVLTILGRDGIGGGLRWLVCILLTVGILAQSGGMFVHMAIGGPTKWSRGNTLSAVGAVLLAVALLATAYAVIAA